MSNNSGNLATRGGLSFRLGSIPVSMPWSGVLGVLLIAYLWSPNFATYPESQSSEIITALVFALLFYACVLLHELGHAAVAMTTGYPVHGIVLWVLGGYTSYERRDDSTWREGLIAAAGPAMSLLIGGACAIASMSLDQYSQVGAVVAALAWSNIFLGIYNALPGLPLDGGAVLKSVVWGISGSERRGTVVAAWSGRVVAVAVFVVPVGWLLASGRQPSTTGIVFTGLIAWYLFSGASQALAQAGMLANVPALRADQLARPTIAVAQDMPLAEALRRVEAAGAGGFVTIDSAGRTVGVSHPGAVTAVPEHRRPWVPASSVARALDPALTLRWDLAGRALITAMQELPAPAYVVVGPDGLVHGILITADVERALTAH